MGKIVDIRHAAELLEPPVQLADRALYISAFYRRGAIPEGRRVATLREAAARYRDDPDFRGNLYRWEWGVVKDMGRVIPGIGMTFYRIATLGHLERIEEGRFWELSTEQRAIGHQDTSGALSSFTVVGIEYGMNWLNIKRVGFWEGGDVRARLATVEENGKEERTSALRKVRRN